MKKSLDFFQGSLVLKFLDKKFLRFDIIITRLMNQNDKSNNITKLKLQKVQKSNKSGSEHNFSKK